MVSPNRSDSLGTVRVCKQKVLLTMPRQLLHRVRLLPVCIPSKSPQNRKPTHTWNVLQLSLFTAWCSFRKTTARFVGCHSLILIRVVPRANECLQVVGKRHPSSISEQGPIFAVTVPISNQSQRATDSNTLFGSTKRHEAALCCVCLRT